MAAYRASSAQAAHIQAIGRLNSMGVKVTLTLDQAEAVVLYELLAESAGGTCVPLHTPAEQLAMARLQGALESAMVEPFMPEYKALLTAARAKLTHDAAPV